MPTDLIYITHWWFTFLIIGLLSLPLSFIFFGKFADLGYAFSKQIGFIFTVYFVFILSITRIARFSSLIIYLGVAILFLINLGIFLRHKKILISKIKSRLKIILFQETLFAFGLILWSLVRSYQPDINGLEKFMDYGFINSILRSEYLPPSDMWFSGNPINYYWLGHLWVAVVTKLTAIPASVTYNLMLATI